MRSACPELQAENVSRNKSCWLEPNWHQNGEHLKQPRAGSASRPPRAVRGTERWCLLVAPLLAAHIAHPEWPAEAQESDQKFGPDQTRQAYDARKKGYAWIGKADHSWKQPDEHICSLLNSDALNRKTDMDLFSPRLLPTEGERAQARLCQGEGHTVPKTWGGVRGTSYWPPMFSFFY